VQDALDSGTHQVTITQKGRSWNGTITRTDATNDLAVIRVKGLIAPALRQTPDASLSPSPGDRLLLVGSPYGLEGTVTTGIVSRVTYDKIQTDPAANPGQLRRPAVADDGAVVGVLLSGGGENLNFLMPIQRLRNDPLLLTLHAALFLRERCLARQQLRSPQRRSSIVGRSPFAQLRRGRRELRPGVNAELAIDAREVRLHGLHAHEELSGDLLVRGAAGCEVGNPPFGGAQLSTGRAMDARSLELSLGAFAPDSCAELLEDRSRLLEGFRRLRFALRAALDRAGGKQRPCVLERLVVVCMYRVRVTDRGACARQVAQLREHKGAAPR